MGLIDLKTDLKSLKYGKDKVGGGSSKQPFVQKPIPDSFSGIGNTGGLDMFVRGGTLAIGKTADDVSRLTKLLLTPSTFQGPAFTAQQNLLSRQGVQTQASPKGVNEGVYLPTSTLAQVAVSSTGLHFNKQGINPVPGQLGSLTTYSDIVSYRQDPSENRLVKFTENFVDKEVSGNTLYSYPGGPGSILGAGETNIQIPVEQRTGINSVNSQYFQPRKYVNLKKANLLLGASDSALLPEDVTGVYFSSKLDKYEFAQSFGPDKVQELISKDLAANLETGTVNAINTQVDSLYAYNNFPGTTLYKLDGFTNSTSFFGASKDGKVSLNIPLSVYGKPSIVTNTTAPKGDQASGVNLQEQSTVTSENGLTGELYTPISGQQSNNGKVGTSFQRTSDPTVQADQEEQAVENSVAFTYAQDQFKTAPTYRKSGQVNDFRQQLRNVDSIQAKQVGANIQAPNYNTQNIENRVHLGDPGKKGDVSNYVAGKDGVNRPVDKINALPIYRSAEVKTTGEETINDLVKFRIALLDPDGSGQKDFIHFRAFLDSITDNFAAQWDSFKYAGRGENFYTYGGFERTVSMGWTVFAQSKAELIPMYKKLNFLASSLAPTYNNGYMQGTFAQLTIGGYLYEMPGVINSISYELSQDTPWEIGITGEGFVNQVSDLSVKELPHMIRVTGFQFTPIPNFLPQRQTATNGPSRFISLSNGAHNNYDS